MTAAAELVPAVGGTRQVPAADPIARDYILLALRLEQHVPGLVDAYFGPADLKAQVDMEQVRAPARLRDDAAALRARLPAAVDEADRREWLGVQLDALGTQAAVLAGEQLSYLDVVERCFAYRPPRRPDDEFRAAAAQVDELLPGPGTTGDRLAQLDARLVVPPDRVLPVARWLIDRFRDRARDLFGLPDGEDLRVSLVTGQPWGAYNWYDGGRRSRVDINTDLPTRAMGLPRMVAHETYPGHHLEHAAKEAELVDRLARLESSVLLINTPESLISEGLGNVGLRFAVAPEDRVGLYVELFERAGLAADEPGGVLGAAELTEALWEPRRALAAADGNAAIMLNADGASRDDVVAYLIEIGGYEPSRAVKRLEFLEHPLWRTYVFVYADGEALLDRWLADVPGADQPARFGRLLREQLTPAAVTAPG